MPVMIGDHCSLRPLRMSDADVTLAWRQNLDTVIGVMGYRLPVTELGERAWYEAALSGKQSDRASFAIELNSDSTLVGLSHLSGIDPINSVAELGIVVAPQARGKGIGKCACALLCAYGFGQINLNRIWLRVATDNHSAIGVYLNLGFRQEGTLREATFRNGSYSDVAVMGMLKREWAALKARPHQSS